MAANWIQMHVLSQAGLDLLNTSLFVMSHDDQL